VAKKKINKKKALSAYFVASLGLAGVSYGVRTHSLTTLGHSAEAIGLFFLLGAAIYLILHLRQKGAATGVHKVVSSVGHFVLAWLGAGLAIFSLGAFIHVNLVSAIVTSAICGPLAVLLVSDKLIVIVFWLAWSWAVGEFLYKTEFAHDSDDKGLSGAANKFRKLVNPSSEKAPTEKPEGAHFLHTRETIEDFIIDEKDLPGRISLGIAHLATGWGKKKEKVHFGAPDDTHVIIYGMTRSGKTQLLIRYILNLDGSVSTHLVVTSTKGQDFLPVVAYLRSCGFDVRIFDVTAHTVGKEEFGTATRWSPVSLCSTESASIEMAEMLNKAVVDSDSRTRDEFWAIQTIMLVAPPLHAAFLGGKDYEWALTQSEGWTNPEMTEVDYILRDRAPKLYDLWMNTRKFLLDMDTSTDPAAIAWNEKAGLSGSAGTGMSIAATVRNFLARAATEEAFRATRNPDFVISDWITSENNEALFLVGDMNFTTRSIFATLANRLIDAERRLADSLPGARLPYKSVFLLDEVANLAPVDRIDKSLQEVGSRGIQVVLSVQSPPQLIDMVGPTKASAMTDAAAVTVLLPGLKDTKAINDFKDLAGNKLVEINEGNKSLVPLVDGPYVVGMVKPNFRTGAPGNGFALVQGGFVELEIPMWSLEEPYCDRGEVPEHFRAATLALREKIRTPQQRRAAALNKIKDRAAADYQRLKHKRKASPETGGSVFARPFIPSNSDAPPSPNASGASPVTETSGADLAGSNVATSPGAQSVVFARPVVTAPAPSPDLPIARPLVRLASPMPLPATPKTKRRGPRTTALIDPKAKALPPISEIPCGRTFVDPFDNTEHTCGQGNACPTCKRALTSA
jgi:type IV secretory pathway TraG/TraD family ATPase VirD4